MSDDAFSTMLLDLYAAALDAGRWPTVLSTVEELTGSVGAVLNFAPLAPDQPGFVMAGRFTDEQCATYSRDYMGICRRIAFSKANPGLDVMYDSMILSEREMDRDPVYDWFARHGLRYYMGGLIGPVADYHVLMSLQRSPAQGHVQADDIALFRRLMPHFSQAIRQAETFGTLSARSRFGAAAIDALPQGVFALDDRGRLLFANAAGEAVLRADDGLLLSEGVLTARRARDARRLVELIGLAAKIGRGEAAPAGGWMQLLRPSGRLPYVLRATPAVGEAARAIFAQPTVLLIVTDPEARLPLDPAGLRAVFGLTATEARVAALVGAGERNEAIAARLGMAPATTRVHLRAIYRKTGVGGREELLQLLGGLGPVAGSAGTTAC